MNNPVCMYLSNLCMDLHIVFYLFLNAKVTMSFFKVPIVCQKSGVHKKNTEHLLSSLVFDSSTFLLSVYSGELLIFVMVFTL